jgi:hypothetical protein
MKDDENQEAIQARGFGRAPGPPKIAWRLFRHRV